LRLESLFEVERLSSSSPFLRFHYCVWGIPRSPQPVTFQGKYGRGLAISKFIFLERVPEYPLHCSSFLPFILFTLVPCFKRYELRILLVLPKAFPAFLFWTLFLMQATPLIFRLPSCLIDDGSSPGPVYEGLPSSHFFSEAPPSCTSSPPSSVFSGLVSFGDLFPLC